MRVAIMQPTYLPWLGYLDLMDQVDVFVFLSDVAFSTQSWQQRNRIRTEAGLKWLTVPVRTKGRSGQLLEAVELADQAFWRKHVASIRHAYARCQDRGLVDGLQATLSRAARDGRLASVNMATITFLRRHFDVQTPTQVSTELSGPLDRIGRLVSLVQHVGGDQYVTPPGSLDYVSQALDQFEAAGIEVLVHRYAHPTYPQLYEPFLPQASAIDALLCVGDEAPGLMRSGRCDPMPVTEFERPT